MRPRYRQRSPRRRIVRTANRCRSSREYLGLNYTLLDLPNAILTQLSAGRTSDSWSRRAIFAVANCPRMATGREPLAYIG